MKKILIDFSKVISPIGISRFVAHNLAPFLSLSEEEIRNIYKTHISELVVGTFSINALITEYLPYSHTTTTAEQLYQQFLRIPPIDTDFLSFLRKQKKSDISYYLVSDLYPELGEQLKSVL
jgi:hypothetical protein